jgi:hypothetical protein
MLKSAFIVTLLAATLLGGCAANSYREYPEVRAVFDNFQSPGDSAGSAGAAAGGSSAGSSGGNGCSR